MDRFKKKMKKEFEMTDLGEMSYFHGMEIRQWEDGVFVNQGKYARDVLRKFGMEKCKSICSFVAQHGK